MRCDYCRKRRQGVEAYGPKTTPWAALFFGDLCPECFEKQDLACQAEVERGDPALYNAIQAASKAVDESGFLATLEDGGGGREARTSVINLVVEFYKLGQKHGAEDARREINARQN